MVRSWLRSLFYAGFARFCPVCERSSRRFLPAGAHGRADAYCPHCGSLERHRLLWRFLTDRKLLDSPSFAAGSGSQLLHIAPEPCLEPRFRRNLGDNYLTADLFASGVMVQLDVADIPYPDHTFAAVYCSHVLEHVSDDRQALREFFRVLRPGGWAILLVPITAPRTIEDPSVIDPAERLRLFGQEDHVRRYGPDYLERLTQAGFHVEKLDPADVAPPEVRRRLALTDAAGSIWFCRKPA